MLKALQELPDNVLEKNGVFEFRIDPNTVLWFDKVILVSTKNPSISIELTYEEVPRDLMSKIKPHLKDRRWLGHSQRVYTVEFLKK